MRGVKSTKNAMPVGVVALRTMQEVASLSDLGGRRGVATASRNGGEARGSPQHFLVQQIRFGVFAEEAAPGASAEEGQNFGALLEFLLHGHVALADARGQGPFSHFGVRGGREIRSAERRVGGEKLGGGDGLEPRGVFFDGGEEVLEPAIV